MDPREIRKRILESLYKRRSDFATAPKILTEELNISDKELDQEIRYLSEKYYLEIKGEYMGQQFLNFVGASITARGIDLIEDPEEFNKLFSIKINHFGDISNSNLCIDSLHIEQVIRDNEIDEDIKKQLKELKNAIEGKNKGKIMSILTYIGDKSVDALIAILTSQIH